MKKIIAVDFDGTLVEDKYPFIGKPNLDLINFIKENKSNYIFILNTLRSGTRLLSAVEYLKEKHELEFDYVNENVPELIDKFGDTRKIAADYYIDDRNIDLKGINYESRYL